MYNKNMTPDFCFITPTAYLEDYAIRSDSHLVLAHLVDSDDVYAAFYDNLSDSDFIMMDCSTYELKEPYSPDKLIELGKKCGADAIVLPDYPFQSSAVTVDAAKKYIPLFKENGFMCFFVPQSERGDIGDWINGYNWAANNPDVDIIGMSILGIPNALHKIHPAYARVVMSQKLIDAGYFNFEKHHHYLGLNSGPGLEIPTLLRMKALDTVDSSGPVQAALMGHMYTHEADSYQMVKKLKMPVDFNLPLTNDEATLMRIDHNIEMTFDLFDNFDDEEVWYAQE